MATQIRHILVAIGDLRRSPRGELRKAGILARAAHAKVELFHAIDEPDPERSFPETGTFQEVEALRGRRAEIRAAARPPRPLAAQKPRRGGGDRDRATAIPVGDGLHSYCLTAELPQSGEER